MTDTPAEIDRRFRSLLLAKSGQERLLMASGMFDSARSMMLASFPDNLSSEAIRRMLLQRTYPELAGSFPLSQSTK